MDNQPSALSAFGKLIQTHLLKIEIVTAAILFLKLFMSGSLPFLGILTIMSLGTLSMFYYLSAFTKKTEKSGALNVLSNKLGGMAYSVAVIGILFRAMHWPGSSSMILIGIVSILIYMGLIFYNNQNENKNLTESPEIIRSALIIFVTVVVYIA